MRNLTFYTPKTLWDSCRGLGEIHGEFDKLFDNMMPTREQASSKDFYPVVDILEDKDKYLIKAELPGVNQKDVKLTVNDNVLTIEGERKNEYEKKKDGIHFIERSYGAFCRSFRLNCDIAADKIAAKSKDGVLEITLPKSEKSKPQEISIKAE